MLMFKIISFVWIFIWYLIKCFVVFYFKKIFKFFFDVISFFLKENFVLEGRVNIGVFVDRDC